MSYLDDLIENGTGFQVRRSPSGASFKPTGGSDAEMEAFQAVARTLIRNDGDGYRITNTHRTSDQARDLIDIVIVTIVE
ncbi:hypothetical protein [Novosphingobium sp. BW1]|uniref:hypothetical protein n=1 Tax=Novosphingobium sp. BW1 TaxID=2592621 RepID=UPI0011DEBA96|nr:hypothetical protein [Novosphingobium sp. BW1]TYC83803.1 hypothetical protein FMM79_19220 [Novosphingobium sp. BW1]